MRIAIFGLWLLSACGTSAPPSEPPNIPGASEIAYTVLKSGSGVLVFAESFLEKSAEKDTPLVEVGESYFAPEEVVQVLQLPSTMVLPDMIAHLSESGRVSMQRMWRQGQIWSADYQSSTETVPLTLLFIDGKHPRYDLQEQPENLRPPKERYLIVYRFDP